MFVCTPVTASIATGRPLFILSVFVSSRASLASGSRGPVDPGERVRAPGSQAVTARGVARPGLRLVALTALVSVDGTWSFAFPPGRCKPSGQKRVALRGLPEQVLEGHLKRPSAPRILARGAQPGGPLPQGVRQPPTPTAPRRAAPHPDRDPAGHGDPGDRGRCCFPGRLLFVARGSGGVEEAPWMPGWSCSQAGEIHVRLFWKKVLGLAGFRTFLTETTTRSQGLPFLAFTHELVSSLHCPGPVPRPSPTPLGSRKPQSLPVPPPGSLPAPGAPRRQLEV